MALPTPPRRRALLWAVSCVGAVVLLWLASRTVPLWPDVLHLPRPGLLALAAALHLPYSLLRAVRLRWALPPGVPVSRDLLVGSGLVSFLVILLLPLRLGELSRPLLLARAGVPGLGLPEAIAAIASERLLDGLLVVGMLFLGLGLSTAFSPEFAALVGSVERFGLASGVVFAGLMLALGLLAFTPPRHHERLGGLVRPVLGARLGEFVFHLAAALRPIFTSARGLFLLAASLVYWAVTLLQLWLVLRACGIDLGAGEAAVIVAIVGLSIQLPGGPAQVGSFQFGAALALQLFIGPADFAGPGASFGALMYLLGLLGALLLALPGLALLGRDRRRRPTDPSPGGPSEPGPIA
ncbi:lysylphosphatidylglycerol synthase domain-containing protein [Nannocystis bainbridge]|uniref:Lysylphosphatidylglycerol synthase domain-containing protein n=1 Tax=Nannocystis bainbridge TaxID=2995303 RepID=A0ABT5E020_9BACT|nr:lysylphosphatidylglycerol synthase domain-containing protein [Nannocystis bainbridge]MDC0718052.1 lysylphosphatidylglycerol synthase domain-containing protein [Nannocystis bainbridge]